MFFHQHLNILKPPQTSKICNSLWVFVLTPSHIVCLHRALQRVPHTFLSQDCNTGGYHQEANLPFTPAGNIALQPLHTRVESLWLWLCSAFSLTHCSICCMFQSIHFLAEAPRCNFMQLKHQLLHHAISKRWQPMIS